MKKTNVKNKDFTPDYFSSLNNMKNKSHEYQQQLPGLLDDLKKYFVFSNKNPEIAEYSSMFENTRIQLAQMQSHIYQLNIQSEQMTAQLNHSLSILTTELEEIKNRLLPFKDDIKRQFQNIYNDYSSSSILINSFTEIYNLNYINNIALGFGILLQLVTFRAIFSAKQITTPITPAYNNNNNKVIAQK